MYIRRLVIKNYKLLKDVEIDLNPDTNVFIGNNDSGKSTLLEALSILTTGKLDGYAFERQLKTVIFNNEARATYITLIQEGQFVAPPQIVFEAYFEECDVSYSGTNNSLGEDCAGIRVVVELSPEHGENYKKMLQDRLVMDIPVELYHITYKYFNGESVAFRFAPFSSVFIDTTRKDYANVMNQFVSNSIAENLTEKEITDLATAYRVSRQKFHENGIVQQLNTSVREQVVIPGKVISIDMKEEIADDWKKQMTIIVGDTPFENIGFGTQNSIKIELAMKNASKQANIVLMEEPENNLSFTNMTLLVNRILSSVGKQVFISTHSSYIANKLSLDKIILTNGGRISTYRELNADAKKYFVKLPGYDTLRFILAEKVILVEGPTDDLIIQRAYKDQYRKLPIEDGIDIIVVDSLAFKRFCDIAVLMKKKIVVVTDNDGDVQTNIKDKYADYLKYPFLLFIYEQDEDLNTIEPSVLKMNCDTDGCVNENFKRVISANSSMMKKNKEEVLRFMLNNKAEWAFRVFEATDSIIYPEYIKNVIKQYH